MERRPCPRCETPLRVVLTEYNFYVPNCVTCGFEDYNRTTQYQVQHVKHVTSTKPEEPARHDEKAA